MARKEKNANYDFADQKDPKKPMGHGDFANMPSEPKFLKFSDKPDLRDGIVNSFTCNVEEISEIHENERG